jgi:hypothetical protein
MSKKWIVVFVVILMLGAIASFAEVGERHRERARTFLVLRITEELELSDDKALQISRILSQSEENREKLRGERLALGEKLRDALKSSDDEKIDELVSQLNEIDRKLVLTGSDSMVEVQKILTPAQRGKLALLIPEIQRRIRTGIARRSREGGHFRQNDE